ncbi:hypothetical protein Hanom_Chr07g00597551 [Helianthus anomalus]
MELTSQMKMARFHTFWIYMRKNKPLDESRKTDQTSRTKMAFYTKTNKQLGGCMHYAVKNRLWMPSNPFDPFEISNNLNCTIITNGSKVKVVKKS